MGRCFAAHLRFRTALGLASRLAAGTLAVAPLTAAALVTAVLTATAVRADCDPGTVALRWPGAQVLFSVDVADTAALREKGLMFRDKMASSAGMLFVYPSPQHAFFWMKNTLIPLDMIFADDTGRVTVVQSDAVPGDLTPIDGGEGVAFVLEIGGGLAKRMGIAPGAELRAAAVDQSKAVWRCAE